MKLSAGSLALLCEVNLVEVKFTRRHPIMGRPTSRRMLATLDTVLLSSKLGMSILNFKPPTQSASYNASSKGLITVWDLFMQDWRNIPVSSSIVVSTIPTRPPEKFWDYFNNVLSKMSAAQKAAFCDK